MLPSVQKIQLMYSHASLKEMDNEKSQIRCLYPGHFYCIIQLKKLGGEGE
jgi:hypothetical protein